MALDIQNGKCVVLDGAVYRLLHRARSNDLCFQDCETGDLLQISEDDLLRKYESGKCALWPPRPPQPKNGVVAKSNKGDWQYKNLELDWGSLTEDQKREVKRGEAYANAIIDAGRPARHADTWPPIIEATAREISDPNEPSWQTVSRWLKRYLANRRDPRSLLSGNSSKGRRRSDRKPEEQKVITDTLQLWLTQEQRTKQWVYEQLEAEYAKARRTVIGATQWQMPSRATVFRMLRDIDLYERVKRREGKRPADYLFHKLQPGKRAEFRLEVVEIDHTRADVWVVDDVEGFLLGRPWLTIAIDRCTRMIVGVYIGFEAPSTHSVMQCIRNMILPKLNMLEKIGVSGPWNPYGVPISVMVDNGREFISDAMREALALLNVTIAQQPVRRPEYKGIVERVMRTIKESGLAWMPGKVPVILKKDRDYDPSKFACITLSDFRKLFFQWLIFEYTHTTHTGIMDIPGRRWAQQVEQNPVFIPNHVNDLESIFGLRVKGIIGRRGLRFRNLFYNNDELILIRRNPKLSNKVEFTVDPGELGFIRVTHPETQEVFKVKAAMFDYAKGLTLYQHDLIRAFTIKRNKAYESEADLVEARNRLRETSLKLLRAGKVKNRSRVTRGAGIGVNQPQSDLEDPEAQTQDARAESDMEQIIVDPDGDPVLKEIIEKDRKEEKAPTDPDVDEEAGASSKPKKRRGSPGPSTSKQAGERRRAKLSAPRSTKPAKLNEAPQPQGDDADDEVKPLPIAKRPAGRRFGPHENS